MWWKTSDIMGLGGWLIMIVILKIIEGREVAPIRYSFLQMFVEII